MSNLYQFRLTFSEQDQPLLDDFSHLPLMEGRDRLLSLAQLGLQLQRSKGMGYWVPSPKLLGFSGIGSKILLRKQIGIPLEHPVAQALVTLPSGLKPQYVFLGWCRLGLWQERRLGFVDGQVLESGRDLESLSVVDSETDQQQTDGSVVAEDFALDDGDASDMLGMLQQAQAGSSRGGK